jgi:membrane protein implicated in regulation of membrane protease activity
VILLLALVLALVLLPWPWSLAVIAAAASCEIAIVVFGIRYTRRRRSTVGVERLIGASAEVVAALTPTGQVTVDGEIWRAHAEAGVRVGDTVRIKSVEGLTLEVEPTAPYAQLDRRHERRARPATFGQTPRRT